MKMTAARATGLDFHAPLVRRDAWFPQDDTRARTYRAGRQFRGPGRVAEDSVDSSFLGVVDDYVMFLDPRVTAFHRVLNATGKLTYTPTGFAQRTASRQKSRWAARKYWAGRRHPSGAE